MNTNFITPPDVVDDERHSVLIVDADPTDIESLALVCANHNHAFNVYLYNHGMQDLEWLVSIASKVDTVIINNAGNGLSAIKQTLIALPNARHYGNEDLTEFDSKYCGVLEYFINYSDNNQHTTTDTL